VTYWALNAFFLGGVAVVALVAVLRARLSSVGGVHWAAVGVATLLLLAMTAVFDNIMIGVGLVGYDETLISGVFIGIAPLEDFAYALAAVVLLPSIWSLLSPRPGSTVPLGERRT